LNYQWFLFPEIPLEQPREGFAVTVRILLCFAV